MGTSLLVERYQTVVLLADGCCVPTLSEREMFVNYLVVRAVESYLDRLIPADEPKLTRD